MKLIEEIVLQTLEKKVININERIVRKCLSIFIAENPTTFKSYGFNLIKLNIYYYVFDQTRI